MKISLLRQKSTQSRHEAGSLVIPDEQRETQSGLIFASTRRGKAIFSPSFVGSRSFNPLNRATFASLGEKISLGSDFFISVNRP